MHSILFFSIFLISHQFLHLPIFVSSLYSATLRVLYCFFAVDITSLYLLFDKVCETGMRATPLGNVCGTGIGATLEVKLSIYLGSPDSIGRRFVRYIGNQQAFRGVISAK